VSNALTNDEKRNGLDMRKAFVLLGLCAVAIALCSNSKAKALEPTTVAGFSLTPYVGTWYEVARIPNVFQRQCATNSIEYYTVLPNGRMGVRNTCQKANGKLSQVKGEAWATDPNHPAQLKVGFFKLLGRYPFTGDYWVLGTDYTGYAIVSDPKRKYCWVMSRQPQLSETQWQQVATQLTQQGLKLNRFILAPQTEGRQTGNPF
jgi:apolipoprotein D and lipocalin family protein